MTTNLAPFEAQIVPRDAYSRAYIIPSRDHDIPRGLPECVGAGRRHHGIGT